MVGGSLEGGDEGGESDSRGMVIWWGVRWSRGRRGCTFAMGGVATEDGMTEATVGR